MHACKNKENRARTTSTTGALRTIAAAANEKKEAAYQSNAAGVASVRSSASPGRLLSPRLGQDSVGNFVIFGRAGEKRGRRG